MRDKLHAAAVIQESTFSQICKFLCSYSLVHLVQFVSYIVVRKFSILWDALDLSAFRHRRKAFLFLVQKRGTK